MSNKLGREKHLKLLQSFQQPSEPPLPKGKHLRNFFAGVGKSYLQLPTSSLQILCFSYGLQSAITETDEVARNGAFERINFGQRFSWTPLAFSTVYRWLLLADRSPSSDAFPQTTFS